MDFSELCALVGALRDRVAELEAKEAERFKGREQIVSSGMERWRTLDGKPISFNSSMAGAEGNEEIRAIAKAAVEAGLRSVPEIKR